MSPKLTLAILLATPLLAQTPIQPKTPPRTWVDKDTGHRVCRLTDEPNSSGFYFNVNAYTPDLKTMIYTAPDGIHAHGPRHPQDPPPRPQSAAPRRRHRPAVPLRRRPRHHRRPHDQHRLLHPGRPRHARHHHLQGRRLHRQDHQALPTSPKACRRHHQRRRNPRRRHHQRRRPHRRRVRRQPRQSRRRRRRPARPARQQGRDDGAAPRRPHPAHALHHQPQDRQAHRRSSTPPTGSTTSSSRPPTPPSSCTATKAPGRRSTASG